VKTQKSRLQELPLAIFEVKFLVEVESDDESIVDVTVTHIVAASIEQCLELASSLDSLDGDRILRVEGIEMIADSIFLPTESEFLRHHAPNA